MSKELLSITQAAQLLNVTVEKLRELDASGIFPAQKTSGGHRRYTSEDVAAFSKVNVKRRTNWQASHVYCEAGHMYCQFNGRDVIYCQKCGDMQAVPL